MLPLDVNAKSTTLSRRIVAVLAWERALIGVGEEVVLQEKMIVRARECNFQHIRIFWQVI